MKGCRLFIGIDVAAAKPMDIAVVDANLNVITLKQCKGPEATAAYVTNNWANADIAIDSPPCHSLGLIPGKNYRVAERELHARGIALYPTPAANAKPWMQAGFDLFDLLKERGWHHFDGEGLPSGGIVCEYYPYAAFLALAGTFVPKKSEPAGWVRRLGLLKDAGVSGDLESLTVDQIDALAGALTADAVRNGEAVWYGIRLRECPRHAQSVMGTRLASAEALTAYPARAASSTVVSPSRAFCAASAARGWMVACACWAMSSALAVLRITEERASSRARTSNTPVRPR